MLGRVIAGAIAAILLLAAAPLRGLGQEAPAEGALGTIVGEIVDAGSGTPIPDAVVEVVGRGGAVRTDLDGRYTIRVPPGTYDLRVYAPLYRSMRVQRILVRPDQTSRADVPLTSAGRTGVDVVEVVGADQATEAAQLAKRQRSTEVRDTISAEAMKKAGGGSAADIVSQAPSVVVKDDKYLNIRGLQERYTSAVLNGSRLPSTDPQRRVVPLDLFPAGFLDAISIVKSYSPNLPGDFSGGLAELELRDSPQSFEGSFGLSTGGNTQSTFDDFDTYPGSRYDYLGFGTDFRELAAGTPGSQELLDKLGAPFRSRLGRQFRTIWDIDSISAPPNFGASGAVGNRFGPFGFQLGVTYGNSYKRRRNEIANNFTNLSPDPFNAQEIGINDSVLYERSQFSTKLGGLFTSGYDISPTQRLTFRALYNRNSKDDVYRGQGFRRNATDVPARQQTFRYVMEELYWLQGGGQHRWPWIEIDWRTAYSRSTQKEPDTRFFTQVGQSGPDPEPWSYVTDSLGGTRLFNDLQEWLSDSAVDFTIPISKILPGTAGIPGVPSSFQFGPAYAYRSRVFNQRRFRYAPTCGIDNSACVDPTLPPEELFAPGNVIGPGGFDFIEQTQPRDNYRVSQEIAAFYAMFEIPIVPDRLRMVGGTRYEYSFIELNSRSDQNEPERVIKVNKNPIPGLSLIFTPREDMNVRLSYGHTVSRPDFRELSPAQYLAPLGEVQTQGNPDLEQSVIDSIDLRWDWFFAPLELLSFSVFHKEIRKPIEQTLLPQGSNPLQSWQNAKDARLTGFEVEARKNFGFLRPHLGFLGSTARQFEYLSLQTSVTYANSIARIPRARAGGDQTVITVQTNTERPMQGQAPFIVNAGLEYDHPTFGTVRLGYSTAGDYIVLVGANGLPDVKTERRNQLDLVLIKPLKDWIGLPLTATLNVENILNQRENWSIGQGVAPASEGGPSGKIATNPGVQTGTVKRYTTGVGIGFSISYSF